MAKKKVAAKRYRADFSLDNVELAKAKSAIKLNIYEKGKKLGELQIGQGSMFWWGANRKTGKRFWSGKLAEILNREAYGADS